MVAEAGVHQGFLLRFPVVIGHLPAGYIHREILRELVARSFFTPCRILIGEAENRAHPQTALGIHILDFRFLSFIPNQFIAEIERRIFHRFMGMAATGQR